MWGATGCGKTTFLAALYVAASRSSHDLNIFGADDTSVEFMVRNTRMLTAEHRFPDATEAVSSYSWTMNMMTFIKQPKRSLFGRHSTVTVPVPTQFNIDLRDAPGGVFAAEPIRPAARLDLGDTLPPETNSDRMDMMDYLADCEGLLLLINPVRERRLGDAYEYFQATLLRMLHRRIARMPPGARLPHYVAVCITKFDDPEVYKFARENGYITFDEGDPSLFPASSRAGCSKVLPGVLQFRQKRRRSHRQRTDEILPPRKGSVLRHLRDRFLRQRRSVPGRRSRQCGRRCGRIGQDPWADPSDQRA